MNSNKKRDTIWSLRSCLAGLTWLMACVPAVAQAQSAVIRKVQATTDHGVTVVEIALTGPTAATLSSTGNSLVVTLPKATLTRGLADQLKGAGLVSGIWMESVAWGERVTLVLRSPSEGKVLTAPDSRTVRIAIGPAGRLAPLASRRIVSLVSVRPVLSLAQPAPGLARSTACALVARPVTVPRLVVLAAPHPVTLIAPPETAPMAATATAVLTPAVTAPQVRLYNVNAYQSDLAGVLNSLAQDSRVSIVMAGPVSSKVTMSLRQVPLEKAVDLLTKSAGLGYHRDGDVFVVGNAKDLAVAYPAPVAVVTRTVYRCLHVSASEVVTTLQNTFDKDKLRVSVGAAPSSPRLDEATTSDVTGVAASNVKGNTGETNGLISHLIVLSGDADLVAQALDLAQKLDVRRTQVKIAVQITDIERSALKNLGLQWTFGNFGITENQPSGIGFGSFTRDPLSVSATITALENKGDAKLLAAPNMSILDGERGFILIGDRLQYPQLTGYTQAQTPIYNVAEERVGIYLQVAVQMEDNGEITLTIYPQVSTVSGYLNVNGASYPQISTREQQTTIRVKDGQQIVVGGLIRDEEINNVQKVPILSQIPFFKELFTYRNTTKDQSEVVILITPQILKD
jgi:type II secretory pathway component GspD/PulD (secretin)